MKTLNQFRKRCAHLAIGPLVGALIAGLLLIVLMLHINNDKNAIEETKGVKQSSVGVLVNASDNILSLQFA